MIEYLPKPRTNARNFRLLTAAAFGDAFGAPYEMLDGQLSLLPVEHVMRENKRLRTPFGTWTDDTALNLAGALGLISQRGAHAPDVVLKEYQLASHANLDRHAPIEDQRSLSRLLRDLPELGWGKACRKALSAGGEAVESNGSGALMRMPALGYTTHIRTYADLYSLADQNSRLTHIGPDHAKLGYMYLTALRHAMKHGPYPRSDIVGGLTQAASEYGPGLTPTYKTLFELVSLPKQDWLEECRRSYAGSSVTDVFYSAMSLALRWVDVLAAMNKPIHMVNIAMDGCLIGGDTDTRLAVALPLCAAICEVPKSVESWDLIEAYDIVLTLYATKFYGENA